MRTRLVVLVLAVAGLAALMPISGAGATSTTTQSLAWIVQPSKTIVNQFITGADVNPSGPPLQVEILNSDGSVDTTSSAPVTITLQPNPAGGTLSGTTTVNAVNGVATFSDLSINKAGTGYVLLASSPGITPAASRGFNEVNAGTTCAGKSSCTATASTPTSTLTLSTSAGSGTLSVSVDVGTPLVCAGYTAQDSNWFSFLSTTTTSGKMITYQVRPAAAGPETVGMTQFCLGAPYSFVQRGGGNAPPGILPDGSSGFIGLVPDCAVSSTGPCVSSRSTTPDASSPTGFDVVLTVRFPAGLAGDPWGRA